MNLAARVSWPPRLRDYKGPGTEDYVATVAASATSCSTCGRPLTTNDKLSLAVTVHEPPDADSITSGVIYREYWSYVSHALCARPAIEVRTVPGTAPSAGHGGGLRL